MRGLIPRELLQYARDEELEEYVRFLAEEADVEGLDSGEWLLQPRQQVAEDALVGLDPAFSHELLYGGTAGPGKTEFLLHHGYHQALKYPGLKVLCLRRTFSELRRSLVVRSLERFDRDECRYTTTENIWKFRNGSSLEFGYCEIEKDVYQYQSAEYDIVIWDELTQWPTDFCYLYLFSRVRSRISTLARGFVPHIVSGTNPGAIGGAWVKARFVDISPPENRVVIESEVEGVFGARIFIPGKLEDNKYINRKQYVAGLANMKKAQRDALLDGSWDAIEGQYFDEWARDVHVVKPFPIPPWWTKIRCVDYGHAAPFCCLWIAFDGDGDAVVYRELYKTQLTPMQQCEQILQSQKMGERIVYSVLDPSCWAKTGVGTPIAQQYVSNGVPVRKAINTRIGGWARVRDYLRIHEMTPDPHAREALPILKPGLRVFSTCVDLIRTFPMLVHDNVDPEDLDTDGEDHAADALRYGLMSRPPRSREPGSEEPDTVQARMAKARKQRDLARMGRGVIDHPELGRI